MCQDKNPSEFRIILAIVIVILGWLLAVAIPKTYQFGNDGRLVVKNEEQGGEKNIAENPALSRKNSELGSFFSQNDSMTKNNQSNGSVSNKGYIDLAGKTKEDFKNSAPSDKHAYEIKPSLDKVKGAVSSNENDKEKLAWPESNKFQSIPEISDSTFEVPEFYSASPGKWKSSSERKAELNKKKNSKDAASKNSAKNDSAKDVTNKKSAKDGSVKNDSVKDAASKKSSSGKILPLEKTQKDKSDSVSSKTPVGNKGEPSQKSNTQTDKKNAASQAVGSDKEKASVKENASSKDKNSIGEQKSDSKNDSPKEQNNSSKDLSGSKKTEKVTSQELKKLESKKLESKPVISSNADKSDKDKSDKPEAGKVNKATGTKPVLSTAVPEKSGTASASANAPVMKLPVPAVKPNATSAKSKPSTLPSGKPAVKSNSDSSPLGKPAVKSDSGSLPLGKPAVKPSDSESRPNAAPTSKPLSKGAMGASPSVNHELSEYIPLSKDPDPMSLNGLLNSPQGSSMGKPGQDPLSTDEKSIARSAPRDKNDSERSSGTGAPAGAGTGIAQVDFQGYSTGDRSSSDNVVQVNGVILEGVSPSEVRVLKPFPDGEPAEGASVITPGSIPPTVSEIKPLPNQREETQPIADQAGLPPQLPAPVSCYVVKQGDSLEILRKKYNMSDQKFEYFLILNDLKNKASVQIKPGMNLLIP